MMINELNAYMDFIRAQYDARVYGDRSTLSDTDIAVRNEMSTTFNAGVRFEEGTKYIKVITGSSVHSFIVKVADSKFQVGDVLKPLSWKAPAKNFKRGNILTKDFGSIQWMSA
jgi:hypothetical protein